MGDEVRATFRAECNLRLPRLMALSDGAREMEREGNRVEADAGDSRPYTCVARMCRPVGLTPSP